MGCRPRPASQGPPQSLQYLSLRNSSPKVNRLLPFRHHPPTRPFSVFAVAVAVSVAVAVACSFVCHPVRDLRLRLPLPLPLKNPSPLPTPDPAQLSPHPSQFIISPLDANPGTVYSLPIFDALAPLANPVAVPRRAIGAATSPRFQFIQSPESFAAAFNPVPPDGGQHTT